MESSRRQYKCRFKYSNSIIVGILTSFAAGAWFAMVVQSNSSSAFFSLIDASQAAIPGCNDNTRCPPKSPIRVIAVDKTLTCTEQNSELPKMNRKVQLFPSEYSDATQTYPETESNDISDDSKMEMKVFPKHESQEECVPMAEWQSTFYPTCSMFHEIDMSLALRSSSISLISSKGHWRDAWEFWDLPQSTWSKLVGGHKDTVVLKTFKYQHEMQDAFFEFSRVDAISMERLTASPFVMGIFGLCGMSVLTEYAAETVTEVVKSINSIGKLFMARLLAKGLSDIHGIDGGGQNISLVHNDINPMNIIVGTSHRVPLFNDFNLGVLQMRNSRTGETCPFTHHFPNPQWRSYEEQIGPDGATKELNEKIDVYALGNLYYRILVGKEPWKAVPWRKANDIISNEDKLIIARLKREEGAIPPIPLDVQERFKDDEALTILYKAMKMCYMYNPSDRPSAKALLHYLDRKLDKFEEKR